jgi:hypothetical protein
MTTQQNCSIRSMGPPAMKIDETGEVPQELVVDALVCCPDPSWPRGGHVVIMEGLRSECRCLVYFGMMYIRMSEIVLFSVDVSHDFYG